MTDWSESTVLRYDEARRANCCVSWAFTIILSGISSVIFFSLKSKTEV